MYRGCRNTYNSTGGRCLCLECSLSTAESAITRRYSSGWSMPSRHTNRPWHPSSHYPQIKSTLLVEDSHERRQDGSSILSGVDSTAGSADGGGYAHSHQHPSHAEYFSL